MRTQRTIPWRFLEAVLDAACELTRSDVCLLLLMADPFVPQLYSSHPEPRDREALERLNREAGRASGHAELARSTILELVLDAFPDYALHDELFKVANRSAAC